MIIDMHSHTVAPPQMYAYQAQLIASRGNPDLGPPDISDELIEEHLQPHLQKLDDVGTDIQFISPRPFHMIHSVKPERIVRRWTTTVNDVIAQQCRLHPDRFFGMAGLPQYRDTSPENCLEELERCVKELRFVGCILDPDPMEGDGPPPPGLGDEFWYPLYEKLVELDVPALVHSASCCSPRESYTLHFINEESTAIMHLLDSRVFEDFPTLKLVISHGGGAIPYHMGRFRAWRFRSPGAESFDDSMRRLHYDTCNYSKESLELLFKVIGTDNCMFGTEMPGTGSAMDPATGRMLDNLKPVIDEIDWLTEADRKKIYEENTKSLYGVDIKAQVS